MRLSSGVCTTAWRPVRSPSVRERRYCSIHLATTRISTWRWSLGAHLTKDPERLDSVAVEEVQDNAPAVDRVRHRPIAQIEVVGQTFRRVWNIYSCEAFSDIIH